MATHRPKVIPKQWYLSKNETINTFNNWKENQLYCLSIDEDFKPFLLANATWGKKTTANPTRGLLDDPDEVAADVRKTKEQKCAVLELMLGQIANWATVITRNQITKDSTSLSDIWNKIRAYYGFLGTGARFLDLSNIKLEIGERPEALYQRLLAFFEDNLMTSGSSVTHHGITATTDEEITPTVENITVFLWLERVHVGLPALVKERYGTELRNKSIASLKSEISLSMDSLLEQLKSRESTSVLRVQSQHNGGFRPQNRSHSNRGGQTQSRGGGGQTSRQSYRPSNRICVLCQTAQRPDYDTHYLNQCRYLPDRDRQRMTSSVRNVEIFDVYENEYVEDYQDSQYEYVSDEFEEEAGLNTEQDSTVAEEVEVVPSETSTQSKEPISRRVMVRKSPNMICFFRHHSVHVCLDCGAESNLISQRCADKLQLNVMKPTQGAMQADAKTPLKVVGDVKNVELVRGAHVLLFEGLVVEEDIGDIVAGEPFLEVNDIAIRSSKKEIRIQDSEVISYANPPQ